MELKDVEALLAVAQHGALLAASRATGISRTTLRRRLESLTESLGAEIVDVQGNQIRLTPAGALLVEEGRTLLTQRDLLLQRARSAGAAPSGEISILSDLGFPPLLTARLLAVAVQAHPGVSVQIHYAPDPLQAMRDDCALTIYWGDEVPPFEGVSRTVIRVPRRLLASQEYLDAHGTPTSLEDLQGHRFLLHTSEPDALPLLSGNLHPVEVTHRNADHYVLSCMAGAGLGIALVPRPPVSIDPVPDALVPVLEDVVGDTLSVRYFAPVRTRHGGPAAAMLRGLDQLADLIHHMP